MRTIIFSKNRAAQLDLLLRSIERFAPWLEPCVLYTADGPDFLRGYERVFDAHEVKKYYEKRSFKEEVVSLIPSSGLIQFLVDDDVFINEWQEASLVLADRIDVVGVSLRLHPGVTYAYTRRENNPVPKISNGVWYWKRAQGHWNYPFSLDGDVYRVEDISESLMSSDFSGPNQFEGAMLGGIMPLIQKYPRAMCYELPKIINIPWNRVQNTVCNSHEGKDAKAMNQKFLDGHRIRTDNIYHIKSNSIHQPIELVLEKR